MGKIYDRLLGERFPDGIPWRSRTFWHPVGYALTAIWMMAILAITGNNVRDPLFDYFFSVPLAGWILGLIAARVVNRFWPTESDDEAGRGKRP
jgi:hypothetical protein